QGLHDHGLQLWVQVQMGDELLAYDLETLADDVDFFVALLHDQTSDSDPAGPIAGQDWFNGWLNTLASYRNPEQWIVALGNYGYDWAEGSKHADQISFPDAMSRAAYAGEDAGESAAPSYNPTFAYTLAGVNHTVWFLDAITFLNEARTAREHGFTGVALTRLGTEDPHLWDALELVNYPTLSADDLAGLQPLQPGKQITNIGQGEIVTVDNSPEEGHRKLSVEDDGRVSAVYEKFPQYPSLYHQGSGGEHLVAITFDDGPDPDWTPKILEILRQKNVPAAFFFVGKQVESNPGLARRVADAGHELGNHTYFHTNLALTADWQTRTELNATQRVIEDVTGRSTTFFRPPYNADERPNDIAELHPLTIAQDLHYLTVLESIDPEDWARPGADVIFQRVKQQRRNGSIVLLHDAGGDRSQTVEALPKIIDYLRARGDTIVPLSKLLELDRDDVNPVVKAGSQPLARWISNFVFRSAHLVFSFLWAFMVVATLLIVLRGALVIALALRQKRRAASLKLPRPTAPLSVVIAAFNEEKVITATLRSVLDYDYDGLVELVVVDDGSKDGTAAAIERFVAAEGAGRVRLLRQPNGGKSAALSAGVQAARHELLVFLDADTLFQRDTLRELAAPFADPKVGAVSGHARVGNLRAFISRCQALEYICGFNLDRRAYDRWNCITVAPGAISALRRSALRQVGGFRTDTLAEDTDLTLSLHRRGWRVAYAANAIAYTESPETIRALARQRFRWCYGTMQCLWKHRDMLFNPKFRTLGFFSLPSIWFFQIGLVAVTPLVDLILIAGLLTGNALVILPYIIVFLLLDQVLAVLACALENEPLRRSWI
ncbi:MAG: glycosyltransferase, partial [Verrucomicrobia bacterium]|nr:glycosyltransferase [Verrucomicrobiota bacterium]